MGPTGNTRIVQIHPTRKCNLSCKHCYSSSSPQATDVLEPEVLKEAMNDLAAEGYSWITFSGGEPLVYDPLTELMSHARSSGMRTTLVSNGMLLTGARLDDIEKSTNALVISLDGKPESHNEMRNSSRAFQTMEKNLPELRRRGIKVGFLFTLTQHNLDELPWVVDFCLHWGASGLLIHPLEIAGNATSQLSGKSPDAQENAYAWLYVEQLKKKYTGQLNIQLDLVHTSAIESNPAHFFLDQGSAPLTGKLSDLLSVLVIEPDGEVVPLQYGFPREYSLGNLKQCRISDMVSVWKSNVGPRLHTLSANMTASLTQQGEGRFINWYEQFDRYARQTQSLPFPVKRTTYENTTGGAA